MKPEPVFAAVEEILGEPPGHSSYSNDSSGSSIYPANSQRIIRNSTYWDLCGHYEGIDERIRQHLVTDEISIGDYVLTGGELPALVVMDAVSRYLPGVLGDPTGAEDDSHASGLIGVSAFYPSTRISRLEGSRCFTFREPCRNQSMAHNSNH